MVIAVKEEKWQDELDQISKTKIRGVLTLLKHAESLSLQPASDQAPVSLGIAKDITCFEDLRNKHDRFLITIAKKENVPITDWRDLIWPDNPDERMRRIAVCKKYESELKTYFEERKMAALEDERRQAELVALTMSTESGCTSRDDWASRDEWQSRDDWASRDEWVSNWSSTETTPNKLYGASKLNEPVISPTYQHNQLLLPPIQHDEAPFLRNMTVQNHQYGNSQCSMQQKQSLPAPSQATNVISGDLNLYYQRLGWRR